MCWKTVVQHRGAGASQGTCGGNVFWVLSDHIRHSYTITAYQIRYYPEAKKYTFCQAHEPVYQTSAVHNKLSTNPLTWHEITPDRDPPAERAFDQPSGNSFPGLRDPPFQIRPATLPHSGIDWFWLPGGFKDLFSFLQLLLLFSVGLLFVAWEIYCIFLTTSYYSV